MSLANLVAFERFFDRSGVALLFVLGLLSAAGVLTVGA